MLGHLMKKKNPMMWGGVFLNKGTETEKSISYWLSVHLSMCTTRSKHLVGEIKGLRVKLPVAGKENHLPQLIWFKRTV